MRIRQGDYRATLSDDHGTYYQGGPACMSAKPMNGGRDDQLGKKIWALDCGFYVPNDRQQPVAVYFVIGTGASSMTRNTLDEIETASQGVLPSVAQTKAASVAQSTAIQLSADSQTAAMPKQSRNSGVGGLTMVALGSIENGRVVKDEYQPAPNFLPPLLHLSNRK